jgi:putative transposase
VQELRQWYPIAGLLKVARMARSTFYYQIKEQSAGDKHAQLKQEIQATYDRHKGRYGYRRITAELNVTGKKINHKKVYRLMNEVGLKSQVRIKKYRSYKGDVGKAAPHILCRDFKAEKANEKWVKNCTCHQSWIYITEKSLPMKCLDVRYMSW